MVSATWIIMHFRVGKHRALTLHFRNMRLRWHLTYPLVTIGLSPFISQLIASTIVIALNKQMLHYSGEVAIGAMGAIFSIWLNITRSILILMPALYFLPRFLGVDGVWLAYPFCDVVGFLVISIALICEIRQLKSGIATA